MEERNKVSSTLEFLPPLLRSCSCFRKHAINSHNWPGTAYCRHKRLTWLNSSGMSKLNSLIVMVLVFLRLIPAGMQDAHDMLAKAGLSLASGGQTGDEIKGCISMNCLIRDRQTDKESMSKLRIDEETLSLCYTNIILSLCFKHILLL